MYTSFPSTSVPPTMPQEFWAKASYVIEGSDELSAYSITLTGGDPDEFPSIRLTPFMAQLVIEQLAKALYFCEQHERAREIHASEAHELPHDRPY